MARKDARPEVSRRKFLTGVAVAGAAATATTNAKAAPPVAAGRIPSALPPTATNSWVDDGVRCNLTRVWREILRLG